MKTIRLVLKKIPGARTAYRCLKSPKTSEGFYFYRDDWSPNCSIKKISITQALNLLRYTKCSDSRYAAQNYPAGYHNIKIPKSDVLFEGRRKPEERVELFKAEIENRSVLDVGSNQGGVAFASLKYASYVVGIDYDPRMVNAANFIKNKWDISRAEFYVFDLDKEEHSIIKDFLPQGGVDVILLFSVCMWIDRWKELVTFCSQTAPVLVFESNGGYNQQKEQVQFLRECYDEVRMLAQRSEDDPENKKRSLLIAKNR